MIKVSLHNLEKNKEIKFNPKISSYGWNVHLAHHNCICILDTMYICFERNVHLKKWYRISNFDTSITFEIKMQSIKHNNNHISDEMQSTKYNNNHITI